MIFFQTSGFAIEGGGDIVVGQEFTDVDKGYEDGIEGEVYGFNLVHAFTSVTTLPDPEFPNTIHFARKRNVVQHNLLLPYNGRRKRQKRGILDMFRNMLMFFAPPPPPLLRPQRPPFPVILKSLEHPDQRFIKNEIIPTGNSRILSNDVEGEAKPFGLLLVELGYDCLLGKGAPLDNDDVDGKVLVSWTKSTVRVFGGAMLKPEIPFCIRH